MAETKETAVLDFKINEDDAIVSIEKLTKANKALREERNKLDLASEQGIKRAQEINSLLDRNTNAIKNNSSAIEKQRANVGNYTESIKNAAGQINGMAGSLDKLVPGLGASVQGLNSATTAGKAFIATPIGAVIGAIAVAVGLVTAAISKSEPVLDFFEDIFKTISTTINTLIVNLKEIGAIIGNVLTGNFVAAADGVADLTKEIKLNNEAAQRQLDLLRELEDAQAKFRIETADTELQIKALVIASKNRSLSLEEQNALLEKAISLEGELSTKRGVLAKKEFDAGVAAIEQEGQIRRLQGESDKEFALRIATHDRATKEQKDSIASLYEAMVRAEEGMIAFREKVQNQQDLIAEKMKERNEKVAEENQGMLIRQRESEIEIEDEFNEIKLLQIDGYSEEVVKRGLELAKKQMAQREKDIKETQKAEATKTKIAQLEAQQRLANVSLVIGQVANLFDKESAAYKTLAITQAFIDTYRAATAALAPPPTGAGPLFGPILAGATIASGIANISKIMGFAGGGSFHTKGPQLIMVGDNPGGVERVDVTPISGRGVTRAIGGGYAMAGGGTMFTNTDGAIMAGGGMSMPNFKTPTVVLSIREYREADAAVTFKDELATV